MFIFSFFFKYVLFVLFKLIQRGKLLVYCMVILNVSFFLIYVIFVYKDLIYFINVQKFDVKDECGDKVVLVYLDGLICSEWFNVLNMSSFEKGLS